MTISEIAFKYERSIVILPQSIDGTNDNVALTHTLMANMMGYGYILSENATKTIQTLSADQISHINTKLIPILQKSKGAHVKHQPMYNNFPKEVIDMSQLELFINAICHYWSLGQWKPESPAIARDFAFEDVKFIEVGIINDEQFNNIFTKLITTNESISETDKTTVMWFLDNVCDLPVPASIPFKENMCLVAGYMLQRNIDVSNFVKTSTDVLRIATFMSGGDVSLADNTKFKSFPRSERKKLVALLDPIISAEDINRHRNKWVKLFHGLHVGDYSDKVYKVASSFRNNERIITFNSKVEAALKQKDVVAATSLLVTRPGEFARRIDHMIRISKPQNMDVVGNFLEVADRVEFARRRDHMIKISKSKKMAVVIAFLEVADQVDTRVLTQLLGNLKVRNKDNDHKIVFPKGNVQRGIKVNTPTEKISTVIVNKLANGIIGVLEARFAELDDLGNVWIDPQLSDCPLPTQQRSASDSLFTVGRGTKLPFGDDKNTLRMFIYWKGQDIDLSATLYDYDFNLVEHVSYTNLKSEGFRAHHSGDITRAPDGASEFIDITIDPAIERGARYVAMNVLVYSGPSFSEHEECFAGWMTRTNPNSNEIYDAKTVEQKIDLRNNSKNCVPVVFDLIERKAIWTDLATNKHSHFGGNNIESNRASITETITAIVTMENKLSLYELFVLHGRTHGTIVNTKEEADTIFSMYEGTTPYNISEINSKYMA